MIRSRYGSKERNFATVFGAFSASNRALNVYGPAMMSIRLMICPSYQERARVESERQLSRRLDQVVGCPRQELAGSGLGLHQSVLHHDVTAADRGNRPAGHLQTLVRRVVDNVLQQVIGYRNGLLRVPQH